MLPARNGQTGELADALFVRTNQKDLVWPGKDVNARKGNRLPHEAGLKLLKAPRAPKELPVSALIRNANGVEDWKLFLNE